LAHEKMRTGASARRGASHRAALITDVDISSCGTTGITLGAFEGLLGTWIVRQCHSSRHPNGRVRRGHDELAGNDAAIFDAPSTYMPTHMLVKTSIIA
jgi:hypothetical protein